MKRLIAVLLALCLVLSLAGCGQKAAPGWQEQFDAGMKYLEELNYEEAALAFTQAIGIDPKQAPAYVSLADAYADRELLAAADKVLYQGAAQTKDKSIPEKYEEIFGQPMGDEEQHRQLLEEKLSLLPISAEATRVAENLEELFGKPLDQVTQWDCYLQTEINFTNMAIEDIAFVQYFPNLESLYVSGSQISDLRPLAGMTRMTELSLGYSEISDISPLAGLTNLKILYLGGSQISDISPLAGLTQLTTLSLDNNQISDISPLAGLTQLNYLSLGNNQISDISPLAGLTQLTQLWLVENQISDYSPLDELLPHLVILDTDDERYSTR